MRSLLLLAVLASAGCAPALRPLPDGPAPAREALLEAVKAAVEKTLPTPAVDEAHRCVAAYPDDAACAYWLAVSLGLQARERPATAPDGIRKMLEAVDRAEALDPRVEHAGPARLRALVLLRAPGWPAGPGDPEAGLDEARRAVDLDPDYPPNLLALAEALAKNDDPRGSEEAARRALAAIRGDEPEAESWRRESESRLRGR